MGTKPNISEFNVTDCERKLLVVFRAHQRDHIRNIATTISALFDFDSDTVEAFRELYKEREDSERPDPCPTCGHVKSF